MVQAILFLTLLGMLLFTGCIGYTGPNLLKMKPYTFFRGGDRFGRDQLANRFLVAEHLFPIKGLNQNEILSLLGQPQEIRVVQKGNSEDWHYLYYKRYKLWPRTDEGLLLVRFYNQRVVDSVKEA